MIRAALMLVVGFVVLHLAGGREYVGILSGTLPGDELELVTGVAYALAWFGAVLAAPILGIAGILSWLLRDRVCGKLVRRAATWIASRRR
jgi:hypothetical protein